MLQKNLFWPFALLILIAGVIFLVAFPGLEVTKWANTHHSAYTDSFFYYCTYIAEWPLVVATIILAGYRQIQLGLAASLIYAFDGIIISVFKNLLSASRPRIEMGIENMHQVFDTTIHSYFSFPSGHTASAVIGFGILSTLTKNRFLQISCALMAAAVGYSRMYLGQHYLRDVMAGAILGLLFVFLFVKIRPKFESFRLSAK